MEPRSVALPAFTLVGMKMRVKPQGKVPGQLWDEFGPRMAEIRHVAGPDVAYGLTTNMDMATGEFDYMAAMQVSRAADVRTGMTAYDVPAQSTEFIRLLEGRMVDLSASQAARIKRVIKQVEANP
jgi:predicted transcriptional regulator YdeE